MLIVALLTAHSVAVARSSMVASTRGSGLVHMAATSNPLEDMIDYCISSRWGYTCFKPGSKALIDLSGGRLHAAVVSSGRPRLRASSCRRLDRFAFVVVRRRPSAGRVPGQHLQCLPLLPFVR